jgi:hypothetical protein
MKKLLYVGLILSFIIATGCSKSAKEKVSGAWKLKSVEGETLTQEQLSEATITFNVDGKVVATAGKDNKMEGTWEVTEDGKTLTIAFVDNSEKEVWNIESLTDKELVYTQGGQKEKITLMR